MGKGANGQTGERVNEMGVRQEEGQTRGESDRTRVRQKESWTNGQVGKRAK
jgi:hypothetical protein